MIYAYSNLGNILEKQGQLEEPIILLKEAVRIKSHNAVIRQHLARLYYKRGIYLNNQGKAQEAIAANREAIRLNPNYTPPYNALALILASQGKSDEAILLYKKAVKINPDLWETQTNLYPFHKIVLHLVCIVFVSQYPNIRKKNVSRGFGVKFGKHQKS